MSESPKAKSEPGNGHAPRRVRSFVRRAGRITKAQQRALERLWPVYGVELADGTLEIAELFPATADIVVDIGFGDGEVLAASARVNADVGYLGIEVYEPGIGHLLLQLSKADISNVRVMRGDAAEILPNRLPPRSLAAVNLFFPDPWPKKRHFKRRLVQPPFVADVIRVLRPRGLLHVATDWTPYAEHVREVTAQFPQLQPVPHAALVNERLAQRPHTKFERRGVALGHEVTDLYYRKL